VQFSLFGADAAEPQRVDLDGLMFGRALWVRHEAEARLSVLVPGGWRETALIVEFARRDLPSEAVNAEGGLRAVRTPFRADLLGMAERWTHGAGVAVPADLRLTPAGLRLWTIASGEPAEHGGFHLGTRDADSALHRRAGAALAALGITAISVSRNPGWRVVGQRRVVRLAEIVGERPPGAGEEWPF
jgi:hypothetical protein